MENVTVKIRFIAKMLVAIVLIAGISSCAKDCEYFESNGNYSKSDKIEDGEDAIVLGEKMKDPYDIAFMSEAFQQLKAEGTELPFDVLEPTGMYIRVLAGSTAELDLLEADTNMTWFDFPLDYEIIGNGTYYHDPTLPDSATWKYGVIPMNYSLPSSLQHELIYNVFIPDDYPEYEKYEEAFDRLEEISESLCGYEEENEEKEISTKASKWNPSATIRVTDDTVARTIPLQGAKVTVRRLTKYRSKITDANGYCFFETKFKKKVNYGIIWERSYWDIRCGSWQAYFNGPEQKGTWTLTISGKKSLMYATMHRALLIAFYGTWGGLCKPTASHSLKVRYLDESRDPIQGYNICQWNIFGIRNNITIYGKNSDNSYKRTHRLFGTVTHELAHQSMLRLVDGRDNFFEYNIFIYESWARCVQWKITSDHYKILRNDPNYSHPVNAPDWTRNSQTSDGNPYPHTPVFVDLIDNYNQRTADYPNRCIDNVSGYILSELQSIMVESYDVEGLRETLKDNLLHGTTEEQIDELLDNYKDLEF